MPSAPRRSASIFVVHVVREIRGLPLTSQGLVERERMIRITTTPVAVSRGFFMSRGLRVNYGPMGEEFFAEFGHDAIGRSALRPPAILNRGGADVVRLADRARCSPLVL